MITFGDVARTLDSEAEVAEREIRGVSALHNPKPATVAFASAWTPEVAQLVHDRPETLFIVPMDAPALANTVRHERPRLGYARVLKAHFRQVKGIGVSPTAAVADGAKLGDGVSIGHFCVIEDGAEIGDGATIGHHTVIASGVTVGENTSIGTHCSIGGPGFGFEHDADGRPIRIEHLGGVQIGVNAEIGNHVVIARGTIESTIISDHVMIDDAVFIAHNVKVGENTFIIAGAEVSGSVEIGRDVWIAPEAAIINKVRIGDRSLVGIGSVVVKDVEADTVVAGVPARPRAPR